MSTPVADNSHGDHLVALPRGTMLYEYRIDSVLGQGGFGITYLAQDTLLNEKVAVKEYFPNETAVRTSDYSARAKSVRDREAFTDGLQSFLTEARIIARFRHPNIMQVRRFFEAHGTGYIVLDFVEGRSLEEVMAAAPLPEPVIMAIFAGVLEGLDRVHQQAILHRDLKPRNIILRESGVPILIDFGAARDFGARDSLTVTKIASPGYSSPEQYGVGGQQGPWSDFYALGAILYRAVTGQVPADSLKRLREDPLVPASKAAAGRYPAPLLRIIDRMMQMDEARRPASAAEIRKALPTLEAARPVPLTALPGRSDVSTRHDWSATRSRPARRRSGARWGLIAAVLVLLLAGAGGAGFWWLRTGQHLMAAPPSATLHEAEAPQAAPQPASPPAPAPEPVAPPAAPPPTQSASPALAPAPAPAVPPHAEPAPATAVLPTPPPAVAPAAPVAQPAPEVAPPVAKPAPVVKAAVPTNPGATFQDCPTCPTMTVLPPGSFQMGSASGPASERPVHRVTFAAPIAMGQHEVTFAEWDACVAAGGCTYKPGDRGWGRGERPVIDLSWQDAQSYVAWLSKTTGAHYRLPSEAEWEYADRAGTTSGFWWGDTVGTGHAACADCQSPALRMTEPAKSFPPNAFGLYDTAGNAAEWVDDCWNPNYEGAPAAGGPVVTGQCEQRVLRGGSIGNDSRYLRSASRFKYDANVRYYTNGFRVARDLK